jgi:hypothetical protein
LDKVDGNETLVIILASQRSSVHSPGFSHCVELVGSGVDQKPCMGLFEGENNWHAKMTLICISIKVDTII